MNQLLAILAIVLIGFLMLFFSILCFRRTWIKPFGVQIPDKRLENLLSSQQTFRMRTKSLGFFWRHFYDLIIQLKPSYWSSNCGVDGYIYLSFQRALMRQIFYMFILSVLICLPANISFSSHSDTWYQKMILNNKELNYFTAWIHVILVFIFSLISLYTLHTLRLDVHKAYFEFYVNRCMQNNVEYLKQRTLHVQGLLPQDKRGNRLVTQINNFLSPNKGSVLGVAVIPDYQELFNLELETLDLKDFHFLVDGQPRSKGCCQCSCVPKKYKDHQSYQHEMEKLQLKMQEKIKKPYISSGHAFICVDSITSLRLCLKEFSLNPKSAMGLCCGLLSDKLTRKAAKYDRKVSTFQKFNDELDDYQSGAPESGNQNAYLMSQCFEPVDINWRNMSGTRGVYLFRRIWINIITLLVLIFLTTPTSIFLSIKMLGDEYAPSWQTSWFYTSEIGNYIRIYTPPIMILIINQILVLLIDWASQLERQDSFSKTQYSVFNKATPYLMLNMLIIPAITLATAKSIYSIVEEKNWNFTRILGDFYTPDSGVFFCTILVQNGTITGSMYLMRIVDILNNYCSSWLSFYRRQMLNDREPWRKTESDIFQFGYYYAQMITSFAIVIMFSSTIPLVSVAGLIYFVIRHFIDGFNLLTVHRKEIQSTYGLASRVILALFISILLYQLAMFGFFMIHIRYYEASVIALIFVVTFVFMCMSMSQKIIDFKKIEQAQLNRRDSEPVRYDIESGEAKPIGAAPFSLNRDKRIASIAQNSNEIKVTSARIIQQVLNAAKKKKEKGETNRSGIDYKINSTQQKSIPASFMNSGSELFKKNSGMIKMKGLGFISELGDGDVDESVHRIQVLENNIMRDWMQLYKHPLTVLSKDALREDNLRTEQNSRDEDPIESVRNAGKDVEDVFQNDP